MRLLLLALFALVFCFPRPGLWLLVLLLIVLLLIVRGGRD